MEIAASIVPIVCSACDVAWNIKDLIKNVKQHDEKMKDLENKLDNLNFILEHAKTAYGQNEGRSYSSPEQDIRKTIENVVIGCNKDLKRFEGKIKSLLAAGNWASVAWKQKSNAPELADIGKSLSERQQRLSLLVQLLQGLELRDLIDIVRRFSNTSPDSTISEDQNADTDSWRQKATSLIAAAESADGPETLKDEEPQSPELSESNENRLLLHAAIEKGDEDTFESLLSNEEMSLVEKDARDRTPLLLAAHLDNVSMVKMILASNAGTENGTDPVEIARLPPSGNDSSSRDTEIRNRRKLDLTATDSVGRTVLHYCTEFGMYDETCILLDNGVSIDARDNDDRPPAYYAVKYRKYKVLKLLLDNGASTEFDRTTTDGTSQEIEELLKKASEKERSSLESSPG